MKRPRIWLLVLVMCLGFVVWILEFTSVGCGTSSAPESTTPSTTTTTSTSTSSTSLATSSTSSVPSSTSLTTSTLGTSSTSSTTSTSTTATTEEGATTTTTSTTTTTILYVVEGSMLSGDCPTTETAIVQIVSDYANPQESQVHTIIADLSEGSFDYVLITSEAGTYYIIGKAPSQGMPEYFGSPGTTNQSESESGFSIPVTFEAGSPDSWDQTAETFSLWTFTE